MDIETQQSVSGFVVGDPRLQKTTAGDSALTMRVGQEHFVKDETEAQGFRQLDNTYFNVVQYGKAAERTFAQFKKGDRFVAEGEVKDFSFTNRDNEVIEGKEFVARKIGHDTAWTRYQVDRTPRGGTVEQGSTDISQGVEAAAPSIADEEPSHAARSRPARGKKAEPAAIDPQDEPQLAAAGADIPF